MLEALLLDCWWRGWDGDGAGGLMGVGCCWCMIGDPKLLQARPWLDFIEVFPLHFCIVAGILPKLRSYWMFSIAVILKNGV